MIFAAKGFRTEVGLQLRPFVEFGLHEMRAGLET
jgi:hypothetical protein